ncbi:MAG: cell wall hydrolase [Burkholderiaceae bacterium]|nr:cell wall hydrolase [Burkholderiaceae bacterium]
MTEGPALVVWLHSALVGCCLLAATPAGADGLGAADTEALGRLVYAEAGTQPIAGKAAVLAVVLNRAATDGSVQAVIDAPGQFEPVLRAPGRTWRGLPPLSAEQRAEFRAILDLALGGWLPDPTGGARFFQNPEIVARRAATGQVRPSLVDFGGRRRTVTIGEHAFYGDRGPTTVTRGKDAGETVFGSMAESDPGETVFLVAAPRRACLPGFGVVKTALSTPIPTLPMADQGEKCQ